MDWVGFGLSYKCIGHIITHLSIYYLFSYKLNTYYPPNPSNIVTYPFNQEWPNYSLDLQKYIYEVLGRSRGSPPLSLPIYISIIIILYIFKLNFVFMSLFMKIFLYLSLTHSIAEPKLGHEFSLFSFKKNTNKYFSQAKMNGS